MFECDYYDDEIDDDMFHEGGFEELEFWGLCYDICNNISPKVKLFSASFMTPHVIFTFNVTVIKLFHITIIILRVRRIIDI